MNIEDLNPVSDVDFKWLEQKVRVAGEISLKHFRQTQAVRKYDNTLVTEADGEIERFLRSELSQAFPQDGLMGEEYPPQPGHSSRTWVIDPIDGTNAYACGLPVWGVSVGILEQGEPFAGVFYMPLVDEMYLCDGKEAFFNGKTACVNESHHVDDETFMCIPSESHRLYSIDFVGKARALGSTAGHMCYVARGAAVAALLGRPALWDVAGALPVLRAAGGTIRFLSSGPEIGVTFPTDGSRVSRPVLAGPAWALDYLDGRITKTG